MKYKFIMNINTDKILICFLCDTQYHELTWKSFSDNFYSLFNVDICLCVEEDSSIINNNEYYNHAKYVWKYPKYRNWDKMLVKQNIQFISPEQDMNSFIFSLFFLKDNIQNIKSEYSII